MDQDASTMADSGTSGATRLADATVDATPPDDAGGDAGRTVGDAGGVRVLAMGQDSPSDIATDGVNVYWTNTSLSLIDGSVMSIATDGGGLTVLAMGGEPASLATDGVDVFFDAIFVGPGDPISKVSVLGGPVTTVVTPPSDGIGGALATDGTNVYWGDFESQTVSSVSVDGGNPSTLASGQQGPAAITTDGANVYWVDYSAGTVMKEARGGTSATTIAANQFFPNAIATDGQFVYFTTASHRATGDAGTAVLLSDGAVMKLGIDGSDLTTLATGLAGAAGIATDGKSVYWTAGGLVQRVAADGTGLTTIASGVPRIGPIATDGVNVYWISGMNTAGGAIHAAPVVP
jgi:hypothetical protein